MYETPDVPEDTTSDYFEDNDAECIERLHISSEDSNNKFKGKYLTGDYAQHGVRGGCWELAAHGEKETPIEKYRRIKCEMDELMNEIVESNANADTSKKEKENYESISAAVHSAQKVLGSLRLEKVLGTETVSSASDSEIKKLIAQVEDFRKDRDCDRKTQIIQLEHTKRVAELEARLHRIESIIGTRPPEQLNRLASTLDTNGTLLDSVQQISTKAALLQPSQLDQIETRIAAITTKLNSINEKTSALSGKTSGNDDKVSALYDIAKKTEPIAKLLPDVLRRMKALESLHNHGEFQFFFRFFVLHICRKYAKSLTQACFFLFAANNFGKTINELESTQSALVSTLNGNKALLQNVQETFALNLESVNQEVGKLESRLKATEKK